MVFIDTMIEQEANSVQNAGAQCAPVVGICAKFQVCIGYWITT